MKQFIKNHFKFIFTILWLTYITTSISENVSYKVNNYIGSRLDSASFMTDANTDFLDKKISHVGQTIIDEHTHTRSQGYVVYKEIIKSMNHHAGFKTESSEDNKRALGI